MRASVKIGCARFNVVDLVHGKIGNSPFRLYIDSNNRVAVPFREQFVAPPDWQTGLPDFRENSVRLESHEEVGRIRRTILLVACLVTHGKKDRIFFVGGNESIFLIIDLVVLRNFAGVGRWSAAWRSVLRAH